MNIHIWIFLIYLLVFSHMQYGYIHTSLSMSKSLATAAGVCLMPKLHPKNNAAMLPKLQNDQPHSGGQHWPMRCTGVADLIDQLAFNPAAS